MKKFVYKTFLLGFAFALLLTFVVISIILIRQKQTDKNFILPEGSTVFFTGDSHVGASFTITDKHTPVMLWSAGSHFEITYMRILKLDRLGALDNIKTIVVSVEEHSTHTSKSHLVDRERQLIGALSWSYPVIFDVISKKQFFDALLTRPMKDLFDIKFLDNTANPKPIDSKKVFLNCSSEKIYECVKKKAEKFESENYSETFENSVYENLMQIKALCDKRNIRLVLFSSPLFSLYKAAINPEAKQRFKKFLDRLKKEGFEYYDYSTQMPDKYFWDMDHLNVEGAKIFTDLFYDEVLNISQ